MRRYAGTDVAEQFQRVLGFALGMGMDDWGEPDAYERTLGDFLDPTRPGRMTAIVNAVSREVGVDAAGWRVDRLLGMVAQIQNDPKPDVPE